MVCSQRFGWRVGNLERTMTWKLMREMLGDIFLQMDREFKDTMFH